MTDESNTSPDRPEAREPAAAPVQEAAEVEALRQDLEAAQAKSAEYLDGWQRARAEFANYKRRIEKEQSEAYQNAAARNVTRFLDVYDDFSRAMQDLPAEGDAQALLSWAAGVGLIQRKLQAILDAEGVERIEAEGQPFDPQLHEAVTQEDSAEHPAGTVIGVVRQGYRLGERVLRPAMVRVAR